MTISIAAMCCKPVANAGENAALAAFFYAGAVCMGDGFIGEGLPGESRFMHLVQILLMRNFLINKRFP
ncbi:MAG: hypothetical protein Q4A06_06850 [Cardiobacteriaceae bacterium]|nr:hypothetical protein [Cardiobacteriaceae bacterium]